MWTSSSSASIASVDEALRSLADLACEAGRAAGLDAVGIAPALPFETTRHDLETRKADGLHGGMKFTFADPARSTDPGRALAGARSLVVGATSYRRARPEPPDGPAPVARVARYSWHDHYAPLRHALDAVAAVLVEAGHRARVLVDSNELVDREAARQAGLGWYGKNANLLLPGHGSFFVLGSVVTDADLPPTGPPAADGCGTCTRCLPACPTGALVAPGLLDARRCLAWLLEAPGEFPREHRVALGDRLYGCDDCQEVCPPNRTEDRHRPAPPPDPGDQAWVRVLDVLRAADTELLREFGRWYIPRRDPRYLRRNALVVLGNTADRYDHEVVAVLDRYLCDPDPLLRVHAAWAAWRLGHRELAEARLADDPDPGVQAELAAWADTDTEAPTE